MQSIFEEYYRIGYTCTDYENAKPIIDLIDSERARIMENFHTMTCQQLDIAKREMNKLTTELTPYFKKDHPPLPRR